jgi:hypothetical protein
MLHKLTFVDSVLPITVFDLAEVRDKFSCKSTPRFTVRPELGRTNPGGPTYNEGSSATAISARIDLPKNVY